MNDEIPRISEDQPRDETRRLEMDWTESEWFRVWLDLARRPYRKQPAQWELATQTP